VRDAEQALPKSRARAASLSNYLSSERAKAPYGLISLAYRDFATLDRCIQIGQEPNFATRRNERLCSSLLVDRRIPAR
jgi:hypothetical protein